MNKKTKIALAILCSLVFVLLALIYFQPVLLQKMLPQDDIINYKGAAEESIRFFEETGEKTYWTNSMFGGMPNYQIWSVFDYYYVYDLHKALNFLPEPANFLFVLLLGFFILGLTLTNHWAYALVGAIFFAFSTYNFIIIEAGHNTKVLAMAYFPPVAAGVLLLYRKKYALGFILTALFLSLQLVANHIQITYYYFLGMLFFIPFQLYDSIKQKELGSFLKASALVFFAVILAVGVNSARLYTTYEYTKHTTRGQAPLSDELVNKTNKNKGLTYDYITNWSYGKLESLNLIIPNFMGGGSVSKEKNLENYINGLRTKPKSQEEFDAVQSALAPTTYWGNQPFTKGPAYMGIIVGFLFLLSLFFVPNRYKWWLLSSSILGLFLAWGKNFELLTHFLVDYFPLYNKFRSVSMALVITQFSVSTAAVLGLYYFFIEKKKDNDSLKKYLAISSAGMVSFLLFLYFFGPYVFSFLNDAEHNLLNNNTSFPLLQSAADDLIKDRIVLFRSDVLRALLFVVLSASLLGLYAYKIVKQSLPLVLTIGLLAIADLWSVDKRYLNDEQFVSDYLVEDYFPTEANQELETASEKSGAVRRMLSMVPINNILSQIKENDPSNYRVFNGLVDPFNDANTSFFHHSVGGYHGAKLRNYQDVIDQHFSSNNPSRAVLNMLNVKYIVSAKDGKLDLIENEQANGNAWFVKNISIVKNDLIELNALDTLNSDKTAVLSKDVTKDIATVYKIDSRKSIKLVNYKPNHLVYEVETKEDAFAVFSEVYYPDGWKLVVGENFTKENSKILNIIPTNYFMRGAVLPAGRYKISMYFDPESAKTGEKLNLFFHVLLFVSLIVSIIFIIKNYRVPSKNSM